MEPAPIYQGQAFATPRVANTSSSMPTKPLFADLWEQNRHEATKALQGIEQALIDRNDNTILLSQQAEAKANDIALTAELKNRLNLTNGAPNGFYDQNGKIIPSAVRELVTRYRNLTHSWQKALIDPTNQQRSAESRAAYQQGITSATEAAILANMHEREATAYKENVQYSMKLGQYDDARYLVAQASADGVLSEPQAGMTYLDIDKQELGSEIAAMSTPLDMARAWDDFSFRSRISQFPDLEARFRDTLERESLRGTPAGVTLARNANGTTSVKRTPAVPPANAPFYLEDHWMKWGGVFKSPEAKQASVAIMQRWLGENIERLQGSQEGDAQWARGRFLANELGISDGEYEQLYETRTKQISFGGFDVRPVLESISRDAFLSTTLRDEIEIAALNDGKPEDIEKIRNRIADAVKDKILYRYQVWYSQNQGHSPQPREQAAQLQNIIEEVKREGLTAGTEEQRNAVEQSVRDNFGKLMDDYIARRTSLIEQQENAIVQELDETRKRRLRSESEGSWRRLLSAPRPTLRTGALGRIASMANMNTFAFELGYGVDAGDLPDSDDKNIIYIPEGQKIPAESMNVLMNNGRNRINIEFRHADVAKPIMSRRLRMSTNTITRNPASVRWDGVNLIFSTENLPDNTIEEATPISGSLLPDEGLAEDYIPPTGDLLF